MISHFIFCYRFIDSKINMKMTFIIEINVPVMVRGMGLLKICKLISDLRRYSLLRIVPLKLALGPTCPNFPALIDLWNGHVYPPSLVLFLPINSNELKYFYLFMKTTFFDYILQNYILSSFWTFRPFL